MSPELFMYVWRGKGVLENCAPGIIAVAAPSEDLAWEKLKKEDPHAYYNVWCGAPGYIFSEDDYETWRQFADEDDEDDQLKAPMKPEVFPILEAPVIVMRGSD